LDTLAKTRLLEQTEQGIESLIASTCNRTEIYGLQSTFSINKVDL
jgi:glutamyl-tRNA reductase